MAKGLYQQPRSPFWWYRFQVGGRRFRGSTGKTVEREARVVLADERQAREHEALLYAPLKGRAATLTFDEACRHYWDEVGQHHAGATKTAWSLNWLQAEIGAETRLDEINGAVVMRLVSRRRGEAKQCAGKGGRLAHSTVNRSVTEPLRKVLRHAANVYEAEICRIDWKKFMLPEPSGRDRECQIEEERDLFAGCREDYKPILRFALLTGRRLSHCVNLKWSDIDFGNRLITFRALKGGLDKPTPMPEVLRELLWDLRGHHREAVFTYLVQKARGSRRVGTREPIKQSGLSTTWRNLKRKVGVKNLRFHDLRHTAASRLLRTPHGNLALVKEVLGHRRIETTMRYAHVQNTDKLAAIQAAAEAAQAALEAAQLQAAVEKGVATQVAILAGKSEK